MVSDQMHEKEKNNQMMVEVLSQIMEFRNGESGLHVVHINTLTRLLLERLVENTDAYNLTPDDCYLISTASAFHDIGKVGIDESILNKPGKLTKEEFETMKEHTLIGASMLDKLEHYKDEKMIKIAYQICRWHHERYDGKGYPDGLTGEQIPIAAQVVSVADVYDALVSKRVYKDAYSHEQAMKMILNGECGAFNPLLMEVLVEIQDKIKEEMPDLFGVQEETHAWEEYLRPEFEKYGYEHVLMYRGGSFDEASGIFYSVDRFSLIESGAFWLGPSLEAGPGYVATEWGAQYPRVCTFVILKDKLTNKEISYYNSHFDYTKDVPVRKNSAEQIINKMKEKNVIGFLSGDLNFY